MSKYIITSGPCSGKSTMINYFSSKGYRTVPEAARIEVDNRISKGQDKENFLGTWDFQMNVVMRDIEMESRLNYSRYDAVFYDRSLLDNLAYVRHLHDCDSTDLIDRCKDRYDKVFLLEQIEWQGGYSRREDASESRELHLKIKEAYEDAGYNLVEIPVDTVHNRTEMIMNHIPPREVIHE